MVPTSAPEDVGSLWLATLQRAMARASHDVKDALNGVSVNLEVIRSRAARPDTPASAVATFGESAGHQLERLTSLLEAVLSLGRADRTPVDVGATLYYYPELDASSGLDSSTFEGYIGLNGSVGAVTIGVYAYRDFTLDATTFQGTAGYSIPIDAKASLNLAATIGNVSPDSGSNYTYYSVGATVPYKLTDAATFTVGANWATHDLTGVADNSVWVTADLTVTF